jgi:hypothetical protein
MVMAVGGWAADGLAAERPIEDFYGEYIGRSVAGNGLQARDINIAIEEVRRGFNVSWSTVTHRKSGKAKRKSYSIDFRRTKRDNIYLSAMRKDVFGNRAPNDPMKGDPYVWARINGDTLSVYALIVTDDGSYDMQVYHRTLTANGMRLEFTRFLEGEAKKTITGELKRVVK